jgi:hypothetical protein
VGGDITNPQTLNRYAYVMNNPTTLNDPRGQYPGGSPPICNVSRFHGSLHAMDTSGMGAGCYPGGEGGGGGVSIDGGPPVPWGFFGEGGVAGGESGVPCPGNLCSGFGTDANGDTVWGEFIAIAGGVTGYYNAEEVASGVVDYDGQLYSVANYQALLQQQYAAQISGQCGTLSGNLSADAPVGSGASVNCNDVEYIQGGHANFPIDCGDWLGGDCAGRWPGGLHIEGDPTQGFWGHNDTASYYVGSDFNWGTFSAWNLFVHGTVDFIGGSLFTYVFGP